ncbi:hypothetical protein [Flavobacterium sp. NRK1]|uniref:hypothetical protein n=1 Tax=Flavobacterium sp. NRK1 TaxID=2954929 RepID=UPI002091F328|nr:hypothetical protein [Flavobacterium sp. NRK1]MCO6147942.1 hypothetical protein [Flavobacterium sp. NRK1]
MIKVFVIGFLILIVSLFICIYKIILLKKEIYYKFIDQSKMITSFDKLMDYDGNWLFKEIAYKELLFDNPENQWLIKYVKSIKKLERASIFLVAIIVVFAIIMKYFEAV